MGSRIEEHLPPFMHVPRDEEDPDYVVSFPPNQLDAARDFFEQYGFVVVRDVLTTEECETTTSEMWDVLERSTPGLDRNNSGTWGKWKSKAFGMCSREPSMTPQILQNRQNPNVYNTFRALSGEEDLLVSHDRWAIMRPTQVEEAWSTMDNLHLDVNPWMYESDDRRAWDDIGGGGYADSHDFIKENNVVRSSFGRNMQAVLNLRDNKEEDGGTQIVPGFHKHFSRWVASIGPASADAEARPSYRFPRNSRINQLGVRITMRAGSMVVWDQRCAHGSKGNNSDKLRIAQFLKMFSARTLTEKRLQDRAIAVRRLVQRSGVHVTEIGKQVFGFRHLAAPVSDFVEIKR
ncbi:hypothetical protein BSKO_08673 [Bryopsis sp. KO-2023]|nr:hypothetical protein BSKO_08673 [Bryopsis sp. KO-2023]